MLKKKKKEKKEGIKSSVIAVFKMILLHTGFLDFHNRCRNIKYFNDVVGWRWSSF